MQWFPRETGGELPDPDSEHPRPLGWTAGDYKFPGSAALLMALCGSEEPTRTPKLSKSFAPQNQLLSRRRLEATN